MNQTHRPAVVVAAFALSAGPLLLIPSGAVADTVGGAAGKAAIEHAELRATGVDLPSKAQIEQRERQQSTNGASQVGTGQQQPSAPSSSSGAGAAAWQLAVSAAFGAVLTGGLVVAARQVTHHGRTVAS